MIASCISLTTLLYQWSRSRRREGKVEIESEILGEIIKLGNHCDSEGSLGVSCAGVYWRVCYGTLLTNSTVLWCSVMRLSIFWKESLSLQYNWNTPIEMNVLCITTFWRSYGLCRAVENLTSFLNCSSWSFRCFFFFFLYCSSLMILFSIVWSYFFWESDC
jgi:hypothetical protein